MTRKRSRLICMDPWRLVWPSTPATLISWCMISSIKIHHDFIKWIDKSWSRRCKCSTRHSTAFLHLKQILSYKQLLFLSSNWRLTWPKSKKEKMKARISRQMLSKTSWRRNAEFSTLISLLTSQRSTRSRQMSRLTSILGYSAANTSSKSWKSIQIWKP